MNNRKKILIVFGLLMAFFVSVTARLIELQVLDHDEWLTRADQIQVREVVQSQPRGRIYDREGRLLAFDVMATSIALDNYHMTKPELLEKLLVSRLNLTQERARGLIYRESYFTWVERKVEPELAEALRRDAEEQGIWGLVFTPEWKRVYPQGSLASNVIGFAGMDNRGLEGVELQYDELLRGREEVRQVVRGGGGIQLESQVLQPGASGNDLTLTLDAAIQHMAERAIQEAVRQRGAKGGFVIVLEPQSGDLLALASDKTYDLNHFETSKPIERNNWMVSLTFEPGSTFKPFSIMAALEAGVAKPDDVINGNQPIMIAGHNIHNAENRSYGWDTLTNLFKDSVNTAIIRVTQELDAGYLYQFLTKFGFGDLTGIAMPGEVPGILRTAERWQGTDMAAISIGQAVSVTGIQLAAAYAALANGGWLRTPRIIANVDTIGPETPMAVERKVASDASLEQMKVMLARVVADGTGINAQIDGFAIAAKSGTGEKALPGLGYVPGKYSSLFAGFFPVANPQYVIVVVLDEVNTNGGRPFYGGIVAAPVFKEVAQGIIEYAQLMPAR